MGTASTRDAERVRVAWEAHNDRLWRAILAWSGDADVASEAVAEAFAQVIRRGDDVDDVANWVWRAAFRIAAGLLTDWRRDLRRAGIEHEVQSRDALPDDIVALLDALDRLPSDDRRVVVLAHVGGWSSGEIASLTSSTPGAVRIRLHRARRALRRALEDSDG